MGVSTSVRCSVGMIANDKSKKVYTTNELVAMEQGANVIRYSTERFSSRYIMKGRRMSLQQYFYDNKHNRDTVNYTKIKEIIRSKTKDSLQTDWYLNKGKVWILIGQYSSKKGVDY
ncbi:hypothetical protein [Myroides sp. N17-2]|uniref:hypothetical protein n=1 Tax=Myroides sp. N17-2 TaxID=2030799 RepID=UPI000EFB6CC8|nr:hypothetical protein [Myroides sp. N17-2]